MERQAVLQMYADLENLSVPLMQDPQMGLLYLREKMVECRQAQDRANLMFMTVNREFAQIRQAVRSQKAILAVLPPTQTREVAAARNRLNELEDQEDDLRYLVEAVKAKSSNLRMTSSDIRSLIALIEQQYRTGEAGPGRPVQPWRPHSQDQPLASSQISEIVDENSVAQPIESVLESVEQAAVPQLEQPQTLEVVPDELEDSADIDAFLNAEEPANEEI